MDMTASYPTGAWERWRARTPELRRKLIGSLKQSIADRGQTRVVIGLSGGLDSTVAAYLFVEWAAAVGAHGHARLVATMSRSSILEHAPEVLQRRGVFARMPIEEIEPRSCGNDEEPVTNRDVGGRDSQAAALAEAFREKLEKVN